LYFNQTTTVDATVYCVTKASDGKAAEMVTATKLTQTTLNYLARVFSQDINTQQTIVNQLLKDFCLHVLVKCMMHAGVASD
jgi:hypothetical protein